LKCFTCASELMFASHTNPYKEVTASNVPLADRRKIFIEVQVLAVTGRSYFLRSLPVRAIFQSFECENLKISSTA